MPPPDTGIRTPAEFKPEDLMDIIRIEERASERGNSDYFTGAVWLDQIAVTSAPSRLRAYRVTFEPGARTAWHAHPLGQVLHILTGVGRVQRAGEPVAIVRPGDTIVIRPGERHWHGAAPGQTVVHLAMQEALEDGTQVTWFEQVREADYNPA
jgi:quercetin dioxygenase-like cupin family protein